jgi:hypothetical protein
MTFVCLGWGSLIWDETRAAELPTRGDWQTDGPSLPIEFARISSDRRLTLVITPNAKRVPVLWAVLDVDSMEDAVALLARREGPRGGKPTPERNIGRYPGGDESPEAVEIGAWQSGRGFAGAVWTALRPNFPSRPCGVPLLSDAQEHLASLSGTAAAGAQSYIRNAPPQIETEFRYAIMIA